MATASLQLWLKKRLAMRSTLQSYLQDLSAIALLLLPLTLSNAFAILSGHGFNYVQFPQIAAMLFKLSEILINIYPLSLCVITSYYLSHKTNVNSAMFITYALIFFYILSITNNMLGVNQHLPNNPLVALFSAFLTMVYYTRLNLRL